MGFCCSKKKTAAVVNIQDPSSSPRGTTATSVIASVPTDINVNVKNISNKDVSTIPQQASPRVVIGRSVSVKVADDTSNPIHTPRETATSPTTSIDASALVIADISSSQGDSSTATNAVNTSNKPPTSARDLTSSTTATPSPVVVATPPTSARGRVLSVQKPAAALAGSTTAALDYGAIELAPLWDAELKTLGDMGFKDLLTIMPVLKEHMKIPVSQTPELAGVYNEENMRTVINVLAIQAAEVSASTQRVILQTNLANSVEHSTPRIE